MSTSTVKAKTTKKSTSSSKIVPVKLNMEDQATAQLVESIIVDQQVEDQATVEETTVEVVDQVVELIGQLFENQELTIKNYKGYTDYIVNFDHFKLYVPKFMDDTFIPYIRLGENANVEFFNANFVDFHDLKKRQKQLIATDLFSCLNGPTLEKKIKAKRVIHRITFEFLSNVLIKYRDILNQQ